MFIRISDSHVRSISKAVCWRIIGSIDTFVITYAITGNIISAGSVASIESVSKIVLYYLHERAWSNVQLGRKGVRQPPPQAGADALTCTESVPLVPDHETVASPAPARSNEPAIAFSRGA